MSSQKFEKSLQKDGHIIVAGIDEVGRGALAGPLVAACVILPRNSDLVLSDSKMLSANKRSLLADQILDRCIDFGIGLVNNHEIDELKMTEAIRLSYLRSLENMDTGISWIIIDGNYDYLKEYHLTSIMIKADRESSVVSAASIVAKVFRDSLMFGADKSIEGYFFERNVGYGTKDHLRAISSLGKSSLHRKSFKIKKLI